MARLNNLKRFLKEDFPNENQEFIDKMGGVLNPFLEQISNAFNKDINFDNLSREVITVDVENGTGGKLKTATQFKFTLTSKILGFNVINAQNLTNSAAYPISAPWLSWTIQGNIITIVQATGIQDNNKYRFILELIS